MKNAIPVYDIYFFSEFGHKDILVSRFAPYLATHKNLRYPHRHNFYHILLFTEGSGSHSIDFQSFPVNPFQIYFMIPGQVHSWEFDGPVNGYVVNFSPSFFQSFLLRHDFLENFPFFNGSAIDSVINIPEASQQKINTLFEDILSEATSNESFGLNLVRALLIQLFILISRLSDKSNQTITASYNYTLLKNFQQLIEQNYHTLKLPKEYAELLYITPNHLNALCNDQLGISSGEVIRNRIFLEAQRMLTNLDFTISEISNRLNFTDNSYFSKAFKKQFGFTPEEFRTKTLNTKNHE
ncbi:MAG: helix-turn-helix protein [Sphingobacteriales bacterium]|nr:helix-turn-helix protein [Sphingobacteriales bacterium]